MFCATGCEWRARGASVIVPLLVLASMAALVWLARKFVGSLMDEGDDGGDCLIVKRGRREDKLDFSDIEDATDRAFSRPPQVVPQMRCKSKFGWRVAFVPSTDKNVVLPAMSVGREIRHRSREVRT
jgi:hypothetical protein